tara:strand:- start:15800 stop:16939 length:1140 start_codon:yes stop_codon:yes gene_type:complete
MVRGVNYADAGVDTTLGNEASRIFYEASRETWENRKGLGRIISLLNDFSGLRYIRMAGLPEGTCIGMCFDGVGTKMELAERTGCYETVAHDVIAMGCDDAVVRGAEPFLVGSVLDVNSLGSEDENYIDQIEQLAKGYVNAAKIANVAIINGEVAELGERVGGFGPFNCNWGAGVVWFANEKRLLTGNKIRIGDSLVGLREKGFRSNGFSLVRKIMEENNYRYEPYKPLWRESGKTVGDILLTPSTIYTPAVVDMFGGWNLEREAKAEIHGVAHITGGGIPEKLGRMLRPSGFGAVLNNLFEVPELMFAIQKLGKVSDVGAYTTLPMGCGMVIATPGPERVISVADEHGIEGKEIGYVTRTPGIIIISRGAFSETEELVF